MTVGRVLVEVVSEGPTVPFGALPLDQDRIAAAKPALECGSSRARSEVIGWWLIAWLG